MPGYILKPFEDHNLRPWYLSDNSIQITSEIINIATCYQQICWARFMMVANHFTLLSEDGSKMQKFHYIENELKVFKILMQKMIQSERPISMV